MGEDPCLLCRWAVVVPRVVECPRSVPSMVSPARRSTRCRSADTRRGPRWWNRVRAARRRPTRISDEVTGHAVEVCVALEHSGLDYGPISVDDKMKGPVWPCVLVFHTRISTAASPRVWVLGNRSRVAAPGWTDRPTRDHGGLPTLGEVRRPPAARPRGARRRSPGCTRGPSQVAAGARRGWHRETVASSQRGCE